MNNDDVPNDVARYGPVDSSTLNTVERNSIGAALFGNVVSSDVLLGQLSSSYLLGLRNLRIQHAMSDRGGMVKVLNTKADLLRFCRDCIQEASERMGGLPSAEEEQELRIMWPVFIWVLVCDDRSMGPHVWCLFISSFL